MKIFLLISISWICVGVCQSQVTIPNVRANFGIDAHLKTNSFNGAVSPGTDDWFGDGTSGPGSFVIDTSGASYIRQLYISNPATRRMPLFRGMRHPQFSIVNNKMLIDGVFIRDHHGDDSTVFAAGSSKNGMSPSAWSSPTSQGIPDKNDILDMFMHVRRDGPNTADSLWLFGGVSLEGTGGNRYFDFEMYQTDIYYERASLSFKGFGPDAGHTSWQFDATGKVLSAGDIIFTAEYGNSSLSLVEARIWVHHNSLSITPQDFSWGGDFVGAGSGSTFGYANILPKNGATFYSGIQNDVNTWVGPFDLIRSDNSIATQYTPKQFMEFAVNLSTLGLDPLVNIGDPCLMPFRRILVKSRASTSFSAELKDFVGPFDFFRAPMAAASADIPFYCGTNGVSTVSVNNPIVTSLYSWTTIDGNIIGDSIGSVITVNKAGSYIVSQQLMDSCGTSYAKDTVLITIDPLCTVLSPTISGLRVSSEDGRVNLNWTVNNNPSAIYYVIERSFDNLHFNTITRGETGNQTSNIVLYNFEDDITKLTANVIFYRISIIDINGKKTISTIRSVSPVAALSSMKLYPNPVKNTTRVIVSGIQGKNAELSIFDIDGKVIYKRNLSITGDILMADLNEAANWKKGCYIIKIVTGTVVYTKQLIIL